MLRHAAALTLALSLVPVAPAMAQSADEASETAAEEQLTAEKIIEVARDRLRAPGVRAPCKLPDNPNEIVVCASDPNANRVESPTDAALRTGQPGKDSIPRSPNVDGPGIFQGKGMKMGRDPEPPLIVDLTHMPTPLSAEDAAAVYRVEDGPPREAEPQP